MHSSFQRKIILRYGSSIRAIECYLGARMRELKRTDIFAPIVIVCGSNLMAKYLRFQLAGILGGLLNVHFLTIAGLARQLAFEARIRDARNSLPRGGRLANVMEILKTTDTNSRFAAVSDLPGFQKALKAILLDMEEAGFSGNLYTVDNLGEVIPNSPRWKELWAFWQRYRSRIKQYRNEIDDLCEAGDKGSEFERRFGCRSLIVYGFYDFNVAQEEFFNSLAREIEIEFIAPACPPSDDYGSAFDFSNRRLKRWENRFAVKAQLLAEGDRVSIARRLFRYTPDSMQCEIKDDCEIAIAVGNNPLDEVRSIVGRVQELLLLSETSMPRLAIVMWNAKIYLPLFKDALQISGIPFDDIVPRSLAQSRTGRTLLALLALSPNALSRREVMDILAEYPLQFPESSTTPDLAEWEIISIQTGIIEGGRKDWLNALDKLKASQDDAHYNKDIRLVDIEQLELFVRFVTNLFDYLEALARRPDYSDLMKIIQSMAVRWLPDGDEKTLLLKSFEEISIDNQLFLELEYKDIHTFISEYLNELRLPAGTWQNGVLLTTPAGARGLTFEYLFLPGLAQGWAPSGVSESGIISETDRRRINHSLTDYDYFPLPLKDERPLEERLLFALLTGAAEKSLVFSYPKYDLGGGNPLLPSRYIMEYCRVITGRSLDIEALQQLPFFYVETNKLKELRPARVIDKFAYIQHWVEHNLPDAQLNRAVAQIIAVRCDNIIWARRVYQARRNRTRFSCWDAVADDIIESPLIADDISKLSVSEIEEWAKCPFRAFVLNRLKLSKFEEPEARLTLENNIIGALVHQVLARLYLKAGEDFYPLDKRDSDRAVETVSKILDELSGWAKRKWPAPEGVWNTELKNLRMRLRKCVHRLAEIGDSFVKSEVELNIESPYTFTNPDLPALNLKGRIDRLDWSQDGKAIRVIDYKTGQVKFKDNDLGQGTALQLPMYLKMIFDQRPQIEPSFSLGAALAIDEQGEVKVIKFDGSEVGQQIETIEQIFNGFVDARLKSIYPPLPVGKPGEVCRSCPVACACDKRSRATAPDKSLGDTRLEILLRLRRDDIERH